MLAYIIVISKMPRMSKNRQTVCKTLTVVFFYVNDSVFGVPHTF